MAHKTWTNATSIPRLLELRLRDDQEEQTLKLVSVDAKYVRSIDATKAFPRAPSNAPAPVSRRLQKVIEPKGHQKETNQPQGKGYIGSCIIPYP